MFEGFVAHNVHLINYFLIQVSGVFDGVLTNGTSP